METLKTLGWCLALAAFLLYMAGCVNCNLAIRGTIDDTRQQASTEGSVRNDPQDGATSISAEKTTDVALPISK